MPQRPSLLQGPEYVALLDKLVEHGWISRIARHESGEYFFTWTAKGVEFARFLRFVTGELGLSPRLFGVLAVFCELHGLAVEQEGGE